MAGSGQRDSVDKVIERYFPAVTLTPFEYKGKHVIPKNLKVSCSIFFKRMTCVANCGACCRRFTNDWLPSEIERIVDPAKPHVKERMILFSGKEIPILSDVQEDHDSYYCRHLNPTDGRCGIHTFSPFSCDFELLRFSHFEDVDAPELLAFRPFGRGWNMKRIDGERGALCEWYDSHSDLVQIEDVVRKLRRLQDWTNHFGLDTTIPTIIEWVQRGPHVKPLIVGPNVPQPQKGFF